MTDLYTLRAVAKMEGTTHSNLRTILVKLKKTGGVFKWRDYNFILAGKTWLAYRKGAKVRIIDEPIEEIDEPDEKEGGEALESPPGNG